MIGKHLGSLLRNDGSVYLARVFLADTWWTRFRGLQFAKELPQNTGLILKPCRSVHTFWMRFPIHIVFLDATGVVVDCRENLRPWRTARPSQNGTIATLEVSVEMELPRIGERLTVATESAGANKVHLFDPPDLSPTP